MARYVDIGRNCSRRLEIPLVLLVVDGVERVEEILVQEIGHRCASGLRFAASPRWLKAFMVHEVVDAKAGRAILNGPEGLSPQFPLRAP